MKKIEPFVSLNEALRELDNGGRFYNIFTKKSDGKISFEELTKVAGIYGDQAKANLFLELALSRLDHSDKEKILGITDKHIERAISNHPIKHIIPSEWSNQIAGDCLVVEGHLEYVKDQTSFQMMIMIPVMINNVTTFTPIPIYEQYEIYRIPVENGADVMVAHQKGFPKIENRFHKLGGIVKEITMGEDSQKTSLFLEVLYYV